jgi:hypothetical protein
VFLTVHRVKYGPDAGRTTVAIKKHRREGITGEIGEVHFAFSRKSGRFYCEGTTPPDRVGSNPYTDIPDHLLLVTGEPAPEWVEEQLELA